MTTYSRAERLAAIQKAGFADPLTALAVSLAEFGDARDVNAQSQSDVYTNGVREQSFGPWQIFLPAHPNVTQACAMDLTCATAKAAEISKGGTDFGAWSAYNNGSYLRFVDEVRGLVGGSAPASTDTGVGGFGAGPAPSAVDPAVLTRVRQRLGQLLGGGGLSANGIANTLQSEFPNVSHAELSNIQFAASGSSGSQAAASGSACLGIPTATLNAVGAKIADIGNRTAAAGQYKTGAEGAAAVVAAFPDIPRACLKEVADQGAAAVGKIDVGQNIFGIGGIAQALTGNPPDPLKAVGQGFQAIGDAIGKIQDSFRAENLWRTGFLVVGAAMILIGGRVYLSAIKGEGEQPQSAEIARDPRAA